MADLPELIGDVRLTAGEYQIRDSVPLTRPVTIYCEPGVVFCKHSLGYMFRAATDHVRIIGGTFLRHQPGQCNQLLDRSIAAADQRGCQHWSLEHCVFDGVGLALERCDRYEYDGTQRLKGSDLVGNVRVRDCLFRDVQLPWSILCAGAEDVVIDGCRIERSGESGSSGDGIKCQSGSQHIRIVNTHISGSKRDGIDLFDASRVTIDNCSVLDCGQLGIEAKRGVSTHNCTDYHKVVNTRVERCQQTGISLDVNYATAIGCTVIDCMDGFRNAYMTGQPQTRVERGQFIGNMAVGCRRNGFYFAGHKTTVIGNQAVACAKSFLLMGTDLELIGNGE